MQTQTLMTPIPNNQFQNINTQWLAVKQRNPSFHSSFLYGVISTKIYCRPTCTARLARRANIIFYATEDQAQRDGFRPCKRCKPDVPGFVGERQAVVAKAIEFLYINHNPSVSKLSLNKLAEEVGVTASYLCRAFKKTMGVTIGAYIIEFERQENEAGTETLISSPAEAGSGTTCVGTGPQMSETTGRANLTSVEGVRTEIEVHDISEFEESRELEEDIDFSFYLNDISGNDSSINDCIGSTGAHGA